MDKNYEAIKEILDDQIKKIVKKGDISPQELESLYKASAIVLDFETREAMKQAGEGQSHNNYERGGSNDGRSYEGQNSNHYPYYRMFYENGSNANNGGNSYGPVWNQEMREHEMSKDGKMNRENSRNDGRSNERGNSRDSYDGAYDGAYDGSYDGAYDGAYDGSNASYRRGRDARTGRYVSRDGGYSRAMDKERMIGKLQDMMDDAPEKERRALQQCVDKLERQ